MKNIDSFITKRLYEYRTAGSKNMPKDMDKIDGKPAETNGTHGAVGFNEPKDDTAIKKVEIDKDQMNKNMKRLLSKFKTEEPFFIIGKAGWGKTSIIKQLAEKFDREIIVLYLDKMDAVDLGGMPAPIEKGGKVQQELLIPKWATPMFNNPDKKYLLFFDEMNQANPDVMNALMPIVLEHEIAQQPGLDNFFCGAAGNFESENDAVNELSGPLKSRFKPLITWETGTPEAWKAAIEYNRKEWEPKLGKRLFNTFAKEENCMLFDNPRELTDKVFKYIYKIKQGGDFDEVDTELLLDRLEGLVRDDLKRDEKDRVAKLAEALYTYLKASKEDEDKEETSSRGGGRKDITMVPEAVREAVKHAMKYGYISQKENGKDVKYGISRENIGAVVDENDCNAEMLERLIAKYEADGIKFKYEKDKEWKAEGLKDPDED